MNTSTGTAAGTAGIGGLIAIIVAWLLSLKGVNVPDDVALAFGTLLTIAGHYLGGALNSRTGQKS